jgi:hypothetical protein
MKLDRIIVGLPLTLSLSHKGRGDAVAALGLEPSPPPTKSAYADGVGEGGVRGAANSLQPNRFQL